MLSVGVAHNSDLSTLLAVFEDTDMAHAWGRHYFPRTYVLVELKPDEKFSSHPVVALILACPSCHARHIDEGEFETKPHHTHACQFCGMVWRPALVDTVGVRFLPGFKND